MKNKNQYLRFPNAFFCEMCFKNADYYGELFPDHDFIFHKKIFKVVKYHDEVFRFPSTPPKSPTFETDDTYINYVEKFRKNFMFSPQQGKEIVEGCAKVGYNPKEHGWLDYWIVHQAAVLIEKGKQNDSVGT